jgi:hypothetical protein
MSEITYAVGDKVTILDVNKQGEVTAVSEDRNEITVKYTDDAGVEATETGTADKFAPVGEQSSEESSEDTSSKESTGSDEEGSESAE